VLWRKIALTEKCVHLQDLPHHPMSKVAINFTHNSQAQAAAFLATSFVLYEKFNLSSEFCQTTKNLFEDVSHLELIYQDGKEYSASTTFFPTKSLS
jgi:hypothetical protein